MKWIALVATVVVAVVMTASAFALPSPGPTTYKANGPQAKAQ